jgi:hypothetical protein
MNGTTIIPSNLRFKSAPSVDQQVPVSVDSKSNEITEYDRIASVNLAVQFDKERQESTTFRPTFKVSPIYNNAFTGTTEYLPFLNHLSYADAEKSVVSGLWKGFPQYYEYEFYRPNITDQHLSYVSKSAYTYNWSYYLTYPFENNYTEPMYWTDGVDEINWVAQDGIPFVVKNLKFDGTKYISFECISEHNLLPGEYVQLNFSYGTQTVFQVNSLGNGTFGSDLYVFNLYNIGYTGNTFTNNKVGTFKKIIDVTNSAETMSSYYVKTHKVLTDVNDLVVTKAGFEEVPFANNKKFEFSSLTPNNISRISQKNASTTYTFTTNYDLDINNILDNQKRPLNEIFLTIINKGYSGYFNKPFQGVGTKQGWQFNILSLNNKYWEDNNIKSNSNIPVSSYTQTSGSTEQFYYNLDYKSGDTISGDFCEWNNFTQKERIISPYYQKIRYNQDIFKSSNTPTNNPSGYYYQPHIGMVIRVFSSYIETGQLVNVDNVPSWAYYSNNFKQFMWRDLYSYGFVDENLNGVDYPFLNFSHYPYINGFFRLIPDGDIEAGVEGPKFGPLSGFSINTGTVVVKPIVDECE